MYGVRVAIAEGRQTEIVRVLKEAESVSVSDLAQTLGTSEVTIRRDLAELESLGVLRRTRGGAVSTMLRGEELPFVMRALESSNEKARIAAAAVALVADGESVVLDSGTTGVAAARELMSRRVTVMPLAVNSVAALSAADRVSLILPGGSVRPVELSVVGPMVERNLAELRFDTMLLTCCGLDPERGLTAFDMQDAAVKRAAMAVASRVIALVDSTKFARTAMAMVCPTTSIDVVITDTGAPDTAVAALRSNGVEVHCV